MSRRGFSLVEVLVTLVVLVAVVASAVGFVRSQSQSFLGASRRLDALQNARFAISQVERELRTLGAGVAGQQPMLVYGDADVIAFNTDYVENDSSGTMRWATYLNPNVPDASAQAWLLADAAPIPTTAYSYPATTFRQANGAVSPAETHIFWLSQDSSTVRDDDYVLWERTNNGPRELVSRNILRVPATPFFQYFLARRLGGGGDTLLVTPEALLPLIRLPVVAGMSSTDSAGAVRPDSIQAIRINFRITNGLTGVDERVRDVSTMVALPNNGLPSTAICGRTPFPAVGLVAEPDTVPGSGRVVLAWNASPDQESGEADVWQYVVYRKRSGAALWEDPVLNLGKTAGLTSYTVTLGGNTSGAAFDFGVAAQDCTPVASSILSASVTAP